MAKKYWQSKIFFVVLISLLVSPCIPKENPTINQNASKNSARKKIETKIKDIQSKIDANLQRSKEIVDEMTEIAMSGETLDEDYFFKLHNESMKLNEEFMILDGQLDELHGELAQLDGDLDSNKGGLKNPTLSNLKKRTRIVTKDDVTKIETYYEKDPSKSIPKLPIPDFIPSDLGPKVDATFRGIIDFSTGEGKKELLNPRNYKRISSLKGLTGRVGNLLKRVGTNAKSGSGLPLAIGFEFGRAYKDKIAAGLNMSPDTVERLIDWGKVTANAVTYMGIAGAGTVTAPAAPFIGVGAAVAEELIVNCDKYPIFKETYRNIMEYGKSINNSCSHYGYRPSLPLK